MISVFGDLKVQKQWYGCRWFKYDLTLNRLSKTIPLLIFAAFTRLVRCTSADVIVYLIKF
jgi:hypothetical protein